MDILILAIKIITKNIMKKLSWRNAIAEIFFIFIGITLAIAFQNWNEERKERQQEVSVLKELKVALKNDLKDINDNIQTHKRGIDNCQSLLKMLSSKNPLQEVKLIQQAGMATDFTFLISDISAYEYLKSVGLHLIENDTLRGQISYVYDVVYEGIRGVEDNGDPVQKNLFDRIKIYYTANADSFKLIVDDSIVKKDHQLKFDTRGLEYIHSNMINRYQRKVKPAVEKLIKMVDIELEEKT